MNGQMDILESLGDILRRLESGGVDFVARIAPWASPLPTAFLTARATVRHLGWPNEIGVIAGVIVECLGLAATSTALTLRAYNQSKRRSDPKAPFALAATLVAVYFGSVTLLTVLLDTLPVLSVYAPLAFPVLSLAGVATLALRGDHWRRLTAIEKDKAERRERRRTRRVKSQMSNDTKFDTRLDALRAARKAKRDARITKLVTFYAGNPSAGVSEAGQAISVSRQTVYNYLAELEEAGRISRKNGMVKILEGR
jgi:hypothetical protein